MGDLMVVKTWYLLFIVYLFIDLFMYSIIHYIYK